MRNKQSINYKFETGDKHYWTSETESQLTILCVRSSSPGADWPSTVPNTYITIITYSRKKIICFLYLPH